jgi:hypothetical protein
VTASTPRAAPIALRGMPSGLQARPLYHYRTSVDGERVPVKNRRGLLKLERVELAAIAAPVDAPALDARDQRFVLGAERRSWRSIERRYGDRAWDICADFVRAGIVHLRCEVNDQLEVAKVVDWTLAAEWSAKRVLRAEARTANREAIQSRALRAADEIEEISPEFAHVLRTSPAHLPGLPALIAVADDLRDGVVNANPRAFSQRHFGSTKAHDGVARLLERLGIPDWVADATGVRRSSRIGVAGRIQVSADGATFLAGVFAGPLILRSDQRGLAMSLTDADTTLVVVENLQAAETLADARPGLAIIYSGGMPGRATADWVGRLAERAKSTVIATDADLGGIRIAEQLLAVAPKAHLLDVGSVRHEPRPAWPEGSGYRVAIAKCVGGPASPLAEAVLKRGYAVEQELLIIEALGQLPPGSRATAVQ